MNQAFEAAPTENKQQQWTIVLDFPSVVGSPAVLKKFDELAELEEAKTGTGVSIIGQTINLDQDGHFFLRRFEYANGKMTSLGDVKAKDIGSDLEGLLKLTRQRHKDTRTALIIDSHGLGPFGLVGDQGRLSLPKLELTISHGLGKKLDVLDLDSCEMAQVGSVRRLSKSTEHLIASAEFEQGQGQDLSLILNTVFENPHADSATMADSIVGAVKEYSEQGRVGVNTLAHFDTAHTAALDDALNSLGSALTAAMKDESNSKAIRNIIEQIPTYDPENNFEKRDLKMFATGLSKAIQEGKITDKNHELDRAAKGVLAAQSELVKSYFGSADGDQPYDEMGGLSVFLPNGSLKDKKEIADGTADSAACKQVYALAEYPELFAPYSKEKDIAVCMTAKPLADPNTPKSELPQAQKRFSAALDSFVKEQSDTHSGSWARFIHELMR
jgi:Clostripain family